MITYPLPIRPQDFNPAVPKLLFAERRSNEQPTRGTTTCALSKCRLTSLSLKCGDKRSMSFAQGADPRVPRATDRRFNFAPGEDSVTIRWTVENPSLVTGAALMLYRRGAPKPIWIKELSPDAVMAKELTRWKGELDEESEEFPDGLLTVEHGPYLLTMIIDGDTDGDRQTVATTWAEVVIHKVTLSWGKDGHVPLERADIATNPTTTGVWAKVQPAAVTADQLKADLRRREQELLASAALGGRPDQKHRQTEIDLTLDVSAFDGNLITTEADLAFVRSLWGDGPMVPLFARALVRKADGSGVDRPKLLGRTAFVWEWRDNDDTDLDDHLEGWLGDPDDITNPVSRITRRFLRETFVAQANHDFPRHAFNCPETAGGKRGRASPDVNARPVFPEQDGAGEFPFEVERPMASRTWCAVSYSDAAKGVRDRDGRRAHTGVLFHPSCVAGDRFRVTVYPAPGGWHALDVLAGNAFLDLETEAPELPFAKTPYFHVWRELRATYLFTPAFALTVPALEQAVANQYKRELGFIVTSNRKAFPDLSNFLDAAIAREVTQNANFRPEGVAALLRASKPLVRDPNSDYAIDALTARDDQRIKDLVALGDLYFFESPLTFHTASGPSNGDGLEFTIVGGGGAGGMLLPAAVNTAMLPAGMRMLVVPTGTVIATNDVIQISISKPANHPVNTHYARDTLGWLCRYEPAQYTFAPAVDGTLSDRQIVVTIGGIIARLDYPEGVVRPTRALSDTRTTALDGFMRALFRSGAVGQLDVAVNTKKITGREGQRATNVADYLRTYLVTPAAIGDEFLNVVRHQALELRGAWRHVLNWALQEWVEHEDADLDTRHRVYFGLYRGKTPLDERFVTGGIESDITTLRVGLASVNVPILAHENPIELRWLKDVTTVGAHEFGHALMLKHSSPRLMDSKEASGVFEEHLAHDTCLMNYDADTSSFCALCMLRKRGWDWRPLVTGARGVHNNPAWVSACQTEMETAIQNDDAHVAMKVRLAMFLLSRKAYDPNLAAADLAARQLIAAVLNAVGPHDARRVWALRNTLYFIDKLRYIANTPQQLLQQQQDGVNILEQLADQHVDELYQLSQFALDVSDLTEPDPNRPGFMRFKRNIASVARWKYTQQQGRTGTLP